MEVNKKMYYHVLHLGGGDAYWDHLSYVKNTGLISFIWTWPFKLIKIYKK
jgi:hypothetical protein